MTLFATRDGMFKVIGRLGLPGSSDAAPMLRVGKRAAWSWWGGQEWDVVSWGIWTWVGSIEMRLCTPARRVGDE